MLRELLSTTNDKSVLTCIIVCDCVMLTLKSSENASALSRREITVVPCVLLPRTIGGKHSA
jgi:hypothetical protein